MMLAQSFAVLLSAVSTVFGQANTSFVNYSQEAQPDLTPQTVQLISLGFPDCINGPLATNLVCNATADYKTRAQALISSLTLDELISLSGNTAYGVPRLGLPAYQVWNEALHGLDRANMSDSGDFSWATSFPMPILSMASLNRTLINQIGSIISTQARAFNNWGRYGLDSYAPNINGFRSPIWGRGQETPGEDAFFLSAAYAYEYITGLQGGVNPEHLKIVATPKHFAGYDIENWNLESRLGNDLSISEQDLAGYYMPQFQAAIKDAKAQSLMCSYNAVNGVPSCANSFFLQTILRDQWGFDEYAGYVSTDCDAAYNVFNPHHYAANVSAAAAASIRAGADIDCGTSYQYYLNVSIAEGSISRDDIETAVTRLYSQLVRLGYFDGNGSIYRDLSWDDVVMTDSWNISYEAAVEGLVLLKNDGTLPLPSNLTSVALIGPWANASSQLQYARPEIKLPLHSRLIYASPLGETISALHPT
jgi:beta-D-xylosidase 4